MSAKTESEGEGRRDGAKVGRAGRDFCLVPEERKKTQILVFGILSLDRGS